MNNNIIKNGIEMNDYERQDSIIKTIINMLIARKWIDDDFDKYYNMLSKKNELIDMTHIVHNDKKIAIKFYGSKLNSLKNDKEIDSLFNTYPEDHKIIIVNDISPKAEKQIIDMTNFEAFKEMEVIRDISQHHLVPKHILLSKDDGKKMMDEYNIIKKHMGRIYLDDPMCRYLYAQKDDIIQIIRCSINSGYSTYYRLVIPGSIR